MDGRIMELLNFVIEISIPVVILIILGGVIVCQVNMWKAMDRAEKQRERMLNNAQARSKKEV